MVTKKAAAGEEVWLNTLNGVLRYFTTDTNGKRRYASVRGGKTFRISEHDRDLISSEIALDARNPFLNGRLKRVDDRIAETDPKTGDVKPEDLKAGKTPLPEGHKAEQALEQSELLAIFEKNGMAFQSAVKKLDERNIRSLKALAKEQDVDISVKQSEFIETYLKETYPQGGATSSGQELLEDPRG